MLAQSVPQWIGCMQQVCSVKDKQILSVMVYDIKSQKLGVLTMETFTRVLKGLLSSIHVENTPTQAKLHSELCSARAKF